MPHSSTEPTTALPESPPGDVTAGLDWATTDHAVAVVNSKGTVIEQFIVDATGPGLRELVRRLRRTGVAEVAIERGDGQVVDTLLDAGLTVVVISPNQVHSTCAAATDQRATRTGRSGFYWWAILGSNQ